MILSIGLLGLSLRTLPNWTPYAVWTGIGTLGTAILGLMLIHEPVTVARMVSITEDSNGLRHIQLSNGNRYYEGSVLRSGAELKSIDADGLVLSGGTPNKKPAR